MAKEPTRAEDLGVSTRKLRRFASIRIERLRRISMALLVQLDEQLDDQMARSDLAKFDEAINQLETDLTGVLDYFDEPVGGLD